MELFTCTITAYKNCNDSGMSNKCFRHTSKEGAPCSKRAEAVLVAYDIGAVDC